MISHNLTKQLKLKILPLADPCYLIGASGQNLPTIGRAEVNIQIKGLIIPNTFVVVDGLCGGVNIPTSVVVFFGRSLYIWIGDVVSIGGPCKIEKIQLLHFRSDPPQIATSKRSVVCPPKIFRYGTVLSGSLMSVVCTPSGSRYAKIL